MNYKVEIHSIKDREAIYYENDSEKGKQEILFDFEFKNSINPFCKGVVYLFPESFTNWNNNEQETLSVYKYVEVIKRVIDFFNHEYPKHNVLFGGKKVGKTSPAHFFSENSQKCSKFRTG